MSEIIKVGLDLAKNVFQVHGADDAVRAREERRDPRGSYGLPHPRATDPAAHAGDQCSARPSDVTRTDKLTPRVASPKIVTGLSGCEVRPISTRRGGCR